MNYFPLLFTATLAITPTCFYSMQKQEHPLERLVRQGNITQEKLDLARKLIADGIEPTPKAIVLAKGLVQKLRYTSPEKVLLAQELQSILEKK